MYHFSAVLRSIAKRKICAAVNKEWEFLTHTELTEKYTDLPKKISRLCACSVVVVCATKTKEAQTWQRNGQMARATSDNVQ